MLLSNINSISLQDCFDKNLASDIFVSVWKLKFWQVWLYGSIFGRFANISSLETL